MHATPSSLSSWALAIKRTLDANGCDSLALLRRAGMDPAALSDPGARYPLNQTTRLWRLAVEATGDPAIGLRVASHIRQTTFHALGYTLMASGTMREAFERLTRYYRMVTDAVTMRFDRTGDHYDLLIEPRPGGPCPAPEALDAFVAAYVRMCRSALGREYAPRRIELARPCPPDPRAYHETLRAPLSFGADRTRIVFDADGLDRPLETANAELSRHNDAVILRYLARFDRQDTVTRVRAAVVERLPHGEPPQGRIARDLGMSPRSLQRRLADLGVTYKGVVDAVRRELALSHLSDRDTSVTEVTYRLGFSDVSSFSRAFRRWTGTTPSAWRADRAGAGRGTVPRPSGIAITQVEAAAARGSQRPPARSRAG